MKKIILPYPDIRQENDKIYALISDYSCTLPDGLELHIKRGFDYDGASIPQMFWSLVGSPFTGSHTRAAFVHDALYASELFPRKQCDEIFFKLLKFSGTNRIKRDLFYLMVSGFGWTTWQQHKPQEVAYYRKLITLNV